MIEALGCMMVAGGVLWLIRQLITTKEDRQQDCDNKVAYDWEYNMWFSDHPHHKCKLCRNNKSKT